MVFSFVERAGLSSLTRRTAGRRGRVPNTGGPQGRMERAGEGHAAEHPRRSDKRLLGYKAERRTAPFETKENGSPDGRTDRTAARSCRRQGQIRTITGDRETAAAKAAA